MPGTGGRAYLSKNRDNHETQTEYLLVYWHPLSGNLYGLRWDGRHFSRYRAEKRNNTAKRDSHSQLHTLSIINADLGAESDADRHLHTDTDTPPDEY
jgi:hypothetical protein